MALPTESQKYPLYGSTTGLENRMSSCIALPLVQRKQIQCQNVHMYSRFSGPSGAYHARSSGQDGKIMPAAGNGWLVNFILLRLNEQAKCLFASDGNH